MYLTKDREILDFVRAVQGAQAAAPHVSLNQHIAETADTLGVQTPSKMEYDAMLETAEQTRRRRGKPTSSTQTRGEAVAALIVYFESLGVRPGHALRVAIHRLGGEPISRKGAYEAVRKYKAMTTPDQYAVLAQLAYATRWPGTKLIPPGMMKRRTKSKN